MPDYDEFLGSSFVLEIEDVEVARFTGCSGLTINTNIVEFKETLGTGEIVIRKRPGHTTYEDIVLKRGFSASAAVTDWHKQVRDGVIERHNGSIVIYDSTGTEVDRWNFESGWPSNWSASDLDAGTDDVMIEELTITHERLERAQ
ncbi:MAG: phage tail protein [Acidimicrobiales bacterium]|nr:phage tail protein [Acidimicrobiales bacterium]